MVHYQNTTAACRAVMAAFRFEFVADHAESFSTVFRAIVKTPELRGFTRVFKHYVEIEVAAEEKLKVPED